MKKVNYYFIRHGITKYNVEGYVQGHNDSPLLEEGIFQAKCTGIGLKGIKFNKAYGGSSGRQYITGELALKYSDNDIELIKTDAFREMGYGDFEEGLVSDMMLAASKVLNTKVEHYRSKDNVCTIYDISKALASLDKNCEKIEDTSFRALNKMDEIFKISEDNDNVLIATSSCCLDIIIKTLFPETINYRLVDNCSITLLERIDDHYTLKKYSDLTYRNIGEEVLKAKH